MPLPGQPPVPGQPPAPGGAPPAMAAAQSTGSPVAKPQGAQGNVAQAMSLIRNAIEMVQKALPMIPMGSPLHADLVKVISSVSKHMDQGETNKGVDLQSLLQMARQASQQSPVQAANRMFPAPNAPPAGPTPPPAAA